MRSSAYAKAVLQVANIPGERYGELRRVENRFNGEVNQYFLCDKGRFGTAMSTALTVRASRSSAMALFVTAVSVDQAAGYGNCQHPRQKFWATGFAARLV